LPGGQVRLRPDESDEPLPLVLAVERELTLRLGVSDFVGTEVDLAVLAVVFPGDDGRQHQPDLAGP
jgi:hypothetical protein